MNVTMSGHHVELTQALKDFTQEKLAKLERHAQGITSAHVILAVDKKEQKAEAKLLYKGSDIFAESVSTDLYAAIDTLIDKLNRQILKHKQKVQRKRA